MGFIKDFAKKIIYSIPNFKAMRDDVKFLREENKRLLEHDRVSEEEMNRAHKERDEVYAGNLRLEEEINFLKFRLEEMDKLHDETVLRQWGAMPNMREYLCVSPFRRIEILPDGSVYTCCSAYLKHNFFIGNIYKNSIDEFWNSENAKKLRYSVTVGDFEYCNRTCCWLHDIDKNISEDMSTIKKRSSLNINYKSYEDCVLDYMPEEISLSCDYSCNLTCPSCRNEIKALDKEKSDILYESLMEKIRPMLKECKYLSALASGDVFASKALSRFYKTLSKEEFPNLKIFIITNAQLLNRSKWEEFSNLKGMHIDLAVSIDASEKETYEAIRRGGSWERLNENLRFIMNLKEEGYIKKLSFNFLVQKLNYKQAYDFVNLARIYKADIIEFQKMANWGTFDDEEFIANDVLNPKNELYGEAVEIIKNIVNTTRDIKIIQNII